MTFSVKMVVAVATILLAGCAGYSAGPICTKELDTKANGVRYYEIAPFLLVYSDGKGNLTSQIVMMPDTSKKMVMDLYAYASKNNSTLTFENGVLTTAKYVLDSTTVPSALIDTIKTLGTAAVSTAFNAPNEGATRTIPAPYLFKIVIDNSGTRLVGGQGVGPDNKPLDIKVSVTKEATANAQVSSESNKGGSK
jgi:hypothetical protein